MVKPFLGKSECFAPFLGEKRTNCTQKAGKCLIKSYFYMTNINNFQFSPFFHNFKYFVKSKMAANMAAVLNDVTDP